MRNQGRESHINDVVVKGIDEAVMRHAMREKRCDSCPETIQIGEPYFRVHYFDKDKPLEMFHYVCFYYEFTNVEGGPSVLPPHTSDNNLQDNEG